MWLWGVVMVSVYMIWLLGLRLWLVKVSRSVEQAAPSGSSFAVVLRGPGIAKASDSAVANFARHYGAVVQVMRPVEGGHTFALATQVWHVCLKVTHTMTTFVGCVSIRDAQAELFLLFLCMFWGRFMEKLKFRMRADPEPAVAAEGAASNGSRSAATTTSILLRQTSSRRLCIPPLASSPSDTSCSC